MGTRSGFPSGKPVMSPSLRKAGHVPIPAESRSCPHSCGKPVTSPCDSLHRFADVVQVLLQVSGFHVKLFGGGAGVGLGGDGQQTDILR